MVVSDVNTQFLDKGGTQALIDELKAYIDGLSAGSIDLSDYVTQSELQAKLDALHIDVDLSAYATKQELTTAINSIDLSAYALKSEIPTLEGYATTEYVDSAIANVPTGGTTDLSNYYMKSEVYNKEETDALIPTVTNGVDGQDGVSPTVTVTKEGSVATITCTDVNGTTTATISDGKDGSSGSGGGVSGITYAYDTEIETGDTWIDGKPIYLKVFHVDALSTQPSSAMSYGTYHSQDKFADEIISVIPRWKREDTLEYRTGNYVAALVSVATSSSTVGSSVNSNIVAKIAWCEVINNTDFHFVIGRGQSMYMYSCDVLVRYTKLD